MSKRGKQQQRRSKRKSGSQRAKPAVVAPKLVAPQAIAHVAAAPEPAPAPMPAPMPASMPAPMPAPMPMPMPMPAPASIATATPAISHAHFTATEEAFFEAGVALCAEHAAAPIEPAPEPRTTWWRRLWTRTTTPTLLAWD